MGTRLHIVVSEELVARVDEARGLVPRSAWLRAAVEQALGGRPGASVSPGVQLPAPAPAEQPSWPSDREGRIAKIDGILKDASEAMSPVGRSRSSSQAKRDVRPVPKAKP